MARLEQLGFNALLQLMIGVPLEMVHGLLRISLLYLAGVLAGEVARCPALPLLAWPSRRLPLPAGSLTVSVTDMRAPVVGGSGGVYALCSAHLANVVMVTGCPVGAGRRLGWSQSKACPHRTSCSPELGGDALPLQAAADGAGPGVQ